MYTEYTRKVDWDFWFYLHNRKTSTGYHFLSYVYFVICDERSNVVMCFLLALHILEN